MRVLLGIDFSERRETFSTLSRFFRFFSLLDSVGHWNASEVPSVGHCLRENSAETEVHEPWSQTWLPKSVSVTEGSGGVNGGVSSESSRTVVMP